MCISRLKLAFPRCCHAVIFQLDGSTALVGASLHSELAYTPMLVAPAPVPSPQLDGTTALMGVSLHFQLAFICYNLSLLYPAVLLPRPCPPRSWTAPRLW